MKKVSCVLVVIVFAVVASLAKDGVFYVPSSNLIPLQETSVAWRKEVLKFYVRCAAGGKRRALAGGKRFRRPAQAARNRAPVNQNKIAGV
jgi:hypothetical protein